MTVPGSAPAADPDSYRIQLGCLATRGLNDRESRHRQS